MQRGVYQKSRWEPDTEENNTQKVLWSKSMQSGFIYDLIGCNDF